MCIRDRCWVCLVSGASDARFGFHGLDNNLERFTETIGYTIKSAGGLKGALKQIGGALLGPAGIVAGISIMIAYAPQIKDFFVNAFRTPAQKAKADIEKLDAELTKLRDEHFGTGGTIEDKILDKWDEIIKKQDEYLKNLGKSKDEGIVDSIIRLILPAGVGGPSISDAIVDKETAELQQAINKAAKASDERRIKASKEKKESANEEKEFLKENIELLKEVAQIGAEVSEKDILGNILGGEYGTKHTCLLYTSPSPRDS